MKRGRKSVSEQAIAGLTTIIERRPSPPADLPEAAAALWNEVAGTKPADWWRPDTFPLLASYCLHAVRARLLDEQLDAMQPEWLVDDDGLKRMDKLLMMRDRETKAMVSLARAMRLTQHSQTHKETAARRHRDVVGGIKPWE